MVTIGDVRKIGLEDARRIARDLSGLRATTLVIDGQQRLTSLYTVMKGQQVVGKAVRCARSQSRFDRATGDFEVADAAIRKDPEFLSDVTALWNGTRPKPQIRRDLMNALRDKGRIVDEHYEDAVERNLDRAHSIADYRFPTVDIRKTAATGEATEEDVAEIWFKSTTKAHASARQTSSSRFCPSITVSYATSSRNAHAQCL